MKKTSFATGGVVLLAFIAIQGWAVHRAFIAPRHFAAETATIEGDVVDVRAPVQGLIQSVMVRDHMEVHEDQELFVISRIVTDPATLGWRREEIPILALHAGVIVNVEAKSGMFAQADQKLARIIDNSPETLRVEAVLNVHPDDVPRIRPGSAAEVKASFLNGGYAVRARVDGIDGEYDANTNTVPVRISLLQYPDDIAELPLGLPVDVTVTQERSPDDNLVISFFRSLFPPSQAQEQ